MADQFRILPSLHRGLPLSGNHQESYGDARPWLRFCRSPLRDKGKKMTHGLLASKPNLPCLPTGRREKLRALPHRSGHLLHLPFICERIQNMLML